MQAPLPTSAASGQTPTQSDSTSAVAEISGAVDRITEVRSMGDLWTLVGEFQTELIGFALQLVVAGFVLVAFFGIYRILLATLGRVFDRTRLEEDAALLLLAVLKYTVLGFGLILALDQLGFNVTSLVAGLGIAGLALGFAAKDTLANFIAGITILWDRPFRVGDRVEVDGEFGQVKRITLRSTRIHTNENRVVIIPNQSVVNNKIVNHTMTASLRLDVRFGIAYKEDVDAARKAVIVLVTGDERIRERPAPDVVVLEMAASSVDMALRVWLANPHQEVPLAYEYRERIKKALDRAGITIPYPHMSLYVEQWPERGAGEIGSGGGRP